MGDISKKFLRIVVMVLALVLVPTIKADAAEKVSSEDLVFGKEYNVSFSGGEKYSDFYFSLNQSGRIAISLIRSGICGKTRLFDEAGDVIYETSQYELTDYINLVAGNYIFSIGNYGPWSLVDDVEYTYVINFTPSGETINEFQNARNNMTAKATPYPGGDFTGQLALNDDKDIYSFVVNTDCFTIVDYDPSFSGTQLKLENDNGDVWNLKDLPYGQQSYRYFTPAGTYYLTVSSTKKTGTYSFSASQSLLQSVTLKSIKKYKSFGRRGFKVKFSTNSSADGYQICYSPKKFKSKNKYVSIDDKSINSKIVDGLKKNKTYYVRIRSFRKYGENNSRICYSAWSNTKKIKIK
ncbi:MAG: fibronectin type III domain-containing protein [Lachnospiraceae bacterium]|nr:fibronectin type III domain-containing protein [Lachnospiraceae bacterium]